MEHFVFSKKIMKYFLTKIKNKIKHHASWIKTFASEVKKITYSENKNKRNMLPLCGGFWEY